MPETSQHRERIRLDAIVFDAGTQVRAAINEDTVADYAAAMQAGTKFPPVMLFFDSTRYYMADGFHRGHAALRIGAVDIPAVVTVGTRTDALWYALGANKVNGARLTTDDKRQAILLALKAWPDKGSRELAEQIGCSDRYVLNIKDEVRTTSHLPNRVTGKDGKSYPATRRTEPAPLEPTRGSDVAASAPANQSPSSARTGPPPASARPARRSSSRLHLDQALDEARTWMAKWGHVSALAAVFDALTTVIEQREHGRSQ